MAKEADIPTTKPVLLKKFEIYRWVSCLTIGDGRYDSRR